MTSTTSIPNQVRIWLAQNPGFHATREIAEALGLETKAVSSAVSKLVKADRIVREDGKVADPNAQEAPVTESTEAPAEEPETADETAEEEPQYDVTDEELAARDAEVDEPELTAEQKAGKSFNLAAMKVKIAKLLAKAEGTDNEHERDTFNAKAEKLMLELGVHRAELESAGEVKPEEIIEVVREWKGNYSIVMVPFVHTVAAGFGNLTVLQSVSSAMLRKTYIIGHKSDVNAFTILLDSLALQVMSALHKWQREHAAERRGLTDMEKYVQHRSFISGFGQEVSRRLHKEQVQVKKDVHISSGAELVLASKQERIQGWIDQTYGELKADGRGGMRVRDDNARAHGAAAGRNADLGHKGVKGKKGELS